MEITLIILIANYLPYVIVIGLVFTAGIALTIIGHLWWSLIRAISCDAIAFFTSIKTTQAATSERVVKLRIWETQARAQIQDRRALLQAGNAAAANVGLFDIIIDEALR